MAVLKRELGEQAAAALAAALGQADAPGADAAPIELDDSRDPGQSLN
jgi:hypothetical protein